MLSYSHSNFEQPTADDGQALAIAETSASHGDTKVPKRSADRQSDAPRLYTVDAIFGK
ncbi:MAG: hypothetical protein MZW92_32035 [Comamonadaceae bacterium]|nr:hypothetical protein [Comamonadaceae bacterium]